MALARNAFHRQGRDDPRRNKDKRQLFSNFAIGACTRSTVCLCEKNSREEKIASEEITRASGRHAPSVNRCVATPPR